MRLHRFFIKTPISAEKIEIEDQNLLHQWRNVFRYNTGAELVVFDGSGEEHDALIERISNREALLQIVRSRQGIVRERELVLCQSIIKKDKMEWVVEKATELGVTKIIPVISERSEKKGFNLERAQKIAIEASEQCGRADIPTIERVMALNEALESCENVIVLDSSGSTSPLAPLLAKERGANPSCLFIGPEGGWSLKEIEKFKEAKIEIFSLGKLTLRAETAAIVALSKFL